MSAPGPRSPLGGRVDFSLRSVACESTRSSRASLDPYRPMVAYRGPSLARVDTTGALKPGSGVWAAGRRAARTRRGPDPQVQIEVMDDKRHWTAASREGPRGSRVPVVGLPGAATRPGDLEAAVRGDRPSYTLSRDGPPSPVPRPCPFGSDSCH